ncbi:MAG: thioredoxin family protein [Candidatus Aenigmarchaeota archaeon]|nr:thioredoxin family protein [Candidatus Aenigmarchaeota archaeon]
MVFCIIALVVFGILGIFSTKYRAYAKEAFRCVARMTMLKPCDTEFDQRMKSKITAKIMQHSEKLGKFFYNNFTRMSWVFVIIFFISLMYSAYALFGLAFYGTCDPVNPQNCIINPGNPNQVSCPFEELEPATGVQTIGDFLDIQNAIIYKQDNKVLVYFFGATWCPHCQWEKPNFIAATSKFGAWNDSVYTSNYLDVKLIEIDVIDIETYKTDLEAFKHYSPSGTIPVIIIGGKYFRIGSGEGIGNDVDEKVLTALFCKATGNAVAYCNSDEIRVLEDYS